MHAVEDGDDVSTVDAMRAMEPMLAVDARDAAVALPAMDAMDEPWTLRRPTRLRSLDYDHSTILALD